MDIRGRKMRKPPACVQCRKRKIGCDRVKPMCGNCRKSNRGDCFYPDVPGRYVPSSSSTKSTVEKSDSRIFLNNHTGVTHSKDSSSTLQHNPELASLEQIREYNTRLQLLNAQEHNFISASNGISQENLQFIPRTTQNFENKPVTSASDAPLHLNWVQGPAIFDQITTPYTQEEVLFKEMNFLKARLLELQEITGKKVIDINSFDPVNASINNESHAKRRKLPYESEDDERKEIDDNSQEFDENFDEFKDLDPQFLDPKEVFSIFNNANKSLNLVDKPNSIFTFNFLTLRDKFLSNFRQSLHDMVQNKFKTNLDNWELLQSSKSNSSTTLNEIRFPSRDVTQEMIKKYIEVVKESSTLIPILKPNDLLISIDQSFGREPVFKPTEANLGQLLTFGQISICLLLTYESLISTVLIIFKNDEEKASFNQLIKFTPILQNNLNLIKFELDKRKKTTTPIETLRFLALWKFYQSITSNADQSNYIDFDEDIHFGLHYSINHDQKNESNIILWNFILKHYCWRHLFNGEVPNLLSMEKLDGSKILDSLLKNNHEFINFEIEMVKYLQSNDKVLSISKVLALKSIYQAKFNEQNTKCFNSTTILNNVVDSLIYRNSILFLNYFLLLQYENLGDLEKFNRTYLDFLQLVQDTIFFIFSNLASKNFAGYEFLYIHKLFITLGNITEMVFGVILRCKFTSQPMSAEKSNALKNQNELLSLIIGKLLMLLEDYIKNCKIRLPVIDNIINRMKVILEYDAINSETLKQINSSSVFNVPNEFEHAEVNDLTKFNNKIKNISESLINSDFYSKRQPYIAQNIESYGFTHDNFNSFYKSLQH
ncbi:hypothetical protein KAFR_0E01300 [Kazachstania africana CBS 2517]|uniref:Zn(2)-C6 fungal-type domain-containing protein n=1 Tax=Kazachstania africana (strain ATCC 22294 / BCRC 22015 / CBS 2517 / CECT 1963 / NBRC 1671 / NRRL Y-8276) TaxID=1071382 RepID=H2AV84_KAZAF|nr:hypothetical protein KAFR_0E01300 [Kazachstania africana CBS 2517]CCF58284.1 hypothetical protein KAFR_0E01300 [Kazachstania africana CBS 2517]